MVDGLAFVGLECGCLGVASTDVMPTCFAGLVELAAQTRCGRRNTDGALMVKRRCCCGGGAQFTASRTCEPLEVVEKRWDAGTMRMRSRILLERM